MSTMFLNELFMFSFLILWHSLAATEGSTARRKRYVSEEYDSTFPLSESRKQDFVDAHNKYRRLVQPNAANMRIMTWDDELAALAETYSKNCSFSHSSASFRKTSVFSVAGENIYAGSSYSISQIFDSVPREWYDEYVDYAYDTRSCSPGKICGHYTQLAWAETYKVGCTIAYCNSIQGGHGNDLVICTYGPAGNAYLGDDPLPIYESGDWCSACGENETCENNLCANPDRDQPFTTTTTTTTTTTSLTDTTTDCDVTQCGLTEAVIGCVLDNNGTTECICNEGYAPNYKEIECVKSAASHFYSMKILIQCILACLIMRLTMGNTISARSELHNSRSSCQMFL